MNVLSLFDGISCGMVALERAGIKVDNYYAFEIDKNAITISKKNYPNIIQCGDVTKADFTQFDNIDLIIGGSPCQDLCGMGSRQGLTGEKSKLFYKYVEALNIIKPKYFLLENNASMTKASRDTISTILGVDPIFINSKDYSAQSRKRLYWANFNIVLPPPHPVLLKDVVQPKEEKEYYNCTSKVNKYLSSNYNGRKIQKNVRRKIVDGEKIAPTLGTGCGDIGNNTGYIFKTDNSYYLPTPIECERLQNLPDNYTLGVKDRYRYFVLGNGWTVDVIAHILSNIKE